MNVPNLRFKEFNEELHTFEIKDTGNVITGMTPSTADKENYGTEYLWVSPGDMGYSKYIANTKTKLSLKGFNKTRQLPDNSILVTCIGSTIGKMGMSNSTLSTNQQINSIIPTKIFNPNYLYYCINYNFPKFLNKISFQAVPIISKREFEKLKIKCTPNLSEQEKIGNMLDLLDKKIEHQSKKIEDLKLFKKGLINILNNESFQETALKKIGKFQTSSIDKLINENEKIVNLYNYMDVYNHKIIMKQDLIKLSKTSAKDNQIITNNLKRGDILFTPSSETPDDIGHSICIQEDLPNTVYSYHLVRYRPNIIIDPLFSNYYFNNSKIRKQIIRYATGATRYTISLDNFLKIKVNIPDLITQKKYGLLLYSTDKKINKETFKLNKLQELKKGLMQNMFV